MKTKINDHKPRKIRKELPKHLWETFEWKRIEELEHAKEYLMATAAELQTAVDTLTAAVAKVSTEVAALKAQPPVVQNVEQAQLDANTQAVVDANTALNAL